MIPKLEATFKDGTVEKRTSPRPYKFAWRIKYTAEALKMPPHLRSLAGPQVRVGWSTRRSLAEAALHGYQKNLGPWCSKYEDEITDRIEVK